MRIFKFKKEDMVIDLEEINRRLAALNENAQRLQAFGVRETEHEVWVMMEPGENIEICHFQELDELSGPDLEESILGHWQGDHLFVGEVTPAPAYRVALYRKKYV